MKSVVIFFALAISVAQAAFDLNEENFGKLVNKRHNAFVKFLVPW